MFMEDENIILADEIIPYITKTIFGENAWIFKKSCGQSLTRPSKSLEMEDQ